MSTNTTVTAISLLETTIRAARFNSGRLEAYREGLIDDRSAVEGLLNEAAPGWQSSPQLVFAFGPAKLHLHYSTADQARSSRSRDAIAALAKGLPHGLGEPLRAVACGADGASLQPKGDTRYLVAIAEEASWAKAGEQYPAALPSLSKTLVASFAQAGALSTLVDGGPIAVLEIGLNQGYLLLVGRKGVEGAVPVAFGYDTIYEAVQTELGLKFRGSAARLFYNAQYDFSEFGPKIAAKIAPALQAALKSLPGSPASFCVGDLLAGQQWFGLELAKCLGLSFWAPDAASVASRFKVQLPSDFAAGSVTPAFVGLLHLGLNGQSSGPWLANWEIGMPDAAPAPAAAPAAPAAPAPAAPKPAPAPAPAKPAAPAPAKPVAIPVAPQKQPEPERKPARLDPKSEPTKITIPPKQEAPKPAQAAAPAKQEPAKPAQQPAPAKQEPAKPAPAKQEAPKPAAKQEAPKSSALAYPGAEKKEGKKGSPLVFVGIAAGLALAVGGYFVVSEMNKSKEAAEEQSRLHQQQMAQAEKAAKEATAKAAAEAERARKEAEAKAEAAIAEARKRAEEEIRNARIEEQERIRANTPGVLLVTTEPAAAQISVNGAAPVSSPLTRTDLKPGKYRIVVSHPGYDSHEAEVEISALKTTDTGTIKLVRQAGDLSITSTPSGMDFLLSQNGETIRQGKTPANLENLPLGDYQVIIQRPGWTRSTQTVSLAKGSAQKVNAEFLPGTILVQSRPSNADVLRNGVKIGVTPLRLTDLTPGRINLSLEMKGYDPTPLAGEIVAGREVTLATELLDPNRIVKPSEVKQQPEIVERVVPQKPDITKKYGRVVVSAVVRKTGDVDTVKVDSASDAEWGRLCAEAIANWKFKPGLDANGRPVNVKVSIPIADN